MTWQTQPSTSFDVDPLAEQGLVETANDWSMLGRLESPPPLREAGSREPCAAFAPQSPAPRPGAAPSHKAFAGGDKPDIASEHLAAPAPQPLPDSRIKSRERGGWRVLAARRVGKAAPRRAWPSMANPPRELVGMQGHESAGCVGWDSSAVAGHSKGYRDMGMGT